MVNYQNIEGIYMTFTVWSYDHDASQFHANDLGADTFADLQTAVKTVRQRVRQTCHNTGWAKVRDISDAILVSLSECCRRDRQFDFAFLICDYATKFYQFLQGRTNRPNWDADFVRDGGLMNRRELRNA